MSENLIFNWKITRSGDSMTITGDNARGLALKVSNIRLVEIGQPEFAKDGSGGVECFALATAKSGDVYALVTMPRA